MNRPAPKPRRRQALASGLLLALLALATACGDGEPASPPPVTGDGGANNGGGKTDTPDETANVSCTKRRADALASNQTLFTPTAIRWSCADVDGVNNNNQDDRGQEYCEFFAIVQPPPLAEGDETWPDPVELGRITKAENREDGSLAIETTAPSLALNEDQIYYLEDHPDELLGQCVFTSWHSDVPGPVPACAEGESCPDVLGFPIDTERFRMKMPVNSNSAAWDLLEQCLTVPEGGAADDPDDPRHSDFYRACLLTSELFGTAWRRSDPAICAAAVRMAECGCSLPDGADVAATLIPRQPEEDGRAVNLRGFPLGSWSDDAALPAGCRHLDLGDGSRAVVTCDLTTSDLLDHASDLKRRCVEKYGNDVVVYVPIPAAQVTCQPPEGGQYADDCGEQPWVVTD